MPFFDFHIHPTLKNLFSSENPATGQKKFSPWETVDRSNIPFLLNWCSDFRYVLQSQSNLSQLTQSKCNLVCAALYIPETLMIKNNLIEGQAKSELKIYLHEEKLQKILNGNPYELLMTDDFETLTNAAQFGVTDRKVKPIKSRQDYDEADNSTLHVVFSVEGCHTLSDKLRNFDVPEIIKNIDDLRSRLSLLSINITHIEQSPLCNHAFGIQFIDNDIFKPKGKGFSTDGLKVLKHCYQHKIMVDLKHLSLGSRTQLYSLRVTDEYAAIKQPLVCTHAGFTGISVTEIPQYVFDVQRSNKKFSTYLQGKPVKYGRRPSRPSFNASSINLYDEDIAEIIESGGIIGLSLDKRILGYQEIVKDKDGNPNTKFPVELEYVSVLEDRLFLPHNTAKIRGAFEDGHCLEWDEVEAGGVVLPQLGEYHLDHFLAHVLHFIVVGRKNGHDDEKLMKLLCIGSDFDGIINPIWACDTVDMLGDFKRRFIKRFPRFADESGVMFPGGLDINRFADQLFFENGRDFVLSRLDILNT